MASAITAANNESLKDIIGEVTTNQLTEPYRVFREDEGWNYFYSNGSYKIFNETDETFTFPKDDFRCEVVSGEILVYKKSIECGLLGWTIYTTKLYHISEKRILSQYKIQNNGIYSVNYNKIPIISLGMDSDVNFVFNIKNMLASMLQFIMINNERRQLKQSCIPTEVIDYILPFADFLKINEKGNNDNPLNYKPEDNFDFPEFPKVVSKAQIKKLFDLGMIKMIVSTTPNNYCLKTSLYGEFIVLSDESFDNEPIIEERFGTKENMHGFIHDFMENYLY
jgi:hypothetical protein